MQAGKYKLFCVDIERRIYFIYLIHFVKNTNVIVVHFVLKNVSLYIFVNSNYRIRLGGRRRQIHSLDFVEFE